VIRASHLLAIASLVGCRAKENATVDAPDAQASAVARPSAADAAAGAATPMVSPDRGAELVAANCQACHTEEMLRQQRLTATQWEKVVKKMAGWGANVDADDLPVVARYLGVEYGPDAGSYQPPVVAAALVSRETAPLEDGVFAGGNVARGGSLFAARCAPCHGADARGQIGVNLVDRPLLYRAADFAKTVRDGRAKMPAQPATSDGEVSDLLAHLRTLRPAR
jgi:mono/diheme cytochrome c family protein